MAECGAGFTSKLEGMFKDMEISSDVNLSFKQYIEDLDNRYEYNIDVTMNVINMGYWPKYDVMEVNLPPDMKMYHTLFKNFYDGQHSGRKLQWQPNLDQTVLRANFMSGEKELKVSLIQALCLLPFNSTNGLSLEALAGATNIEDGELRRTLQSLACGKARVLQKNPKGKDINDGDIFAYNHHFTHNLACIKISQVQQKESNDEEKATDDRVAQDRQHLTDAAIVRLMKTRRRLRHNELVEQLKELSKVQLRFPVKEKDIKKRVESLISRDFIRRDQNDSQFYIYVA